MAINLRRANEVAEERRKEENRALMKQVLGEFVKEVNTPELATLATAQSSTRKAVEALPNKLAEEARGALAEMAESQKSALTQSLRPLALAGLILGVAVLVMLALLLLRSTSEPPRNLQVSNGLVAETQTAMTRLSGLQSEVAVISEKLKSVQAQEVETMTRLKAAQDSVQKATLAVQAMAANRETEQAEIERLMRLNQKFQFRLAPTNTGEVVVEIPLNAQPFTLNGRRYITVTTPEGL